MATCMYLLHIVYNSKLKQYFHMVNIAEIEKVNLKMMTCNLYDNFFFDHNKLNIHINIFVHVHKHLLEDGKGAVS